MKNKTGSGLHIAVKPFFCYSPSVFIWKWNNNYYGIDSRSFFSDRKINWIAYVFNPEKQRTTNETKHLEDMCVKSGFDPISVSFYNSHLTIVLLMCATVCVRFLFIIYFFKHSPTVTMCEWELWLFREDERINNN